MDTINVKIIYNQNNDVRYDKRWNGNLIKKENISEVTGKVPGIVHLGLLTKGETNHLIGVQMKKGKSSIKISEVEIRRDGTDVESLNILLKTVPNIKKGKGHHLKRKHNKWRITVMQTFTRMDRC